MLIYRKHNGNGNVKLVKYKFVKFILSPVVNILIIASQISTLPVQDIDGTLKDFRIQHLQSDMEVIDSRKLSV